MRGNKSFNSNVYALRRKLISINHFTDITHEGLVMGWKEKDWKNNKSRKDAPEESVSDIQKEMLRIQGLILCEECHIPYSLYKPKCPNCDEPNKSHYPAKL